MKNQNKRLHKLIHRVVDAIGVLLFVIAILFASRVFW